MGAAERGGTMSNKRLERILDISPELKTILLSTDSLENKKDYIRGYLSQMLISAFEDDRQLPPLEWILVTDAVKTFKSLISARSERLSGFSFLGYLDDLIHRPEQVKPKPQKGFYAEVEALFRGVAGKAGIYKEKAPSFIKYSGERAAKLRSADLSRMAAKAEEFMEHYPCGLDEDAVRRRYRNKQRILEYFNATGFEWDDWKWHVKHIIRDEKILGDLVQLTDEEKQAIALARERRIPFGITPYYASLMDEKEDRKRDYAVRAQVIPPLNYIEKLWEARQRSEASMDFMLENDTSPIEGITRRYPMIVILKPILTCPQICVYCQRNWEIEDVYSQTAALSQKKLERAIQWIADTPEIREVLVTGGDPLLLSNSRIENLLYRLSSIKHIERIRIGTRTPVTLPQRITESLARDIGHFHEPGKREITVITHFEHPYEITPNAMEAVQKIRRLGMSVKNQMVFTTFNSRKFEAAVLRHKLSLIGVSPYYTFNTKGKEETEDYRVPLARLLQERAEEARLMPGTVRTDGVVFNVPGLGKNDITAMQHHSVLSILPNGRRVYEFHPWEKKLSLADTYVYTDVSIYDYLQKLKAWGENLNDYKTIWYYY